MLLEVPVSGRGLNVKEDPCSGLKYTSGALGNGLSSSKVGVFTMAHIEA